MLRGSYLFVDLAPPPDAGLRLVCAGREECAADYRIERESFRYVALEYVVAGRWELTVAGRLHELGPGAVFAYGPTTGYALRAVQGPRLTKYFVDFSGTPADRLVQAAGLAGGCPGHVNQSRWLHDLFDQLLDCSNLPRSAARDIGSRLTEVLLLRVREDLKASVSAHPKARSSFERCREFIRDNYRTISTAGAVARACHLDPAHLSRLFRRYGGEGPLAYLMRLKMDEAAELILRRGYGVKEAGAAVGFADPYHFSRVFKRIHGVAPGHVTRHTPRKQAGV